MNAKQTRSIKVCLKHYTATRNIMVNIPVKQLLRGGRYEDSWYIGRGRSSRSYRGRDRRRLQQIRYVRIGH